MESHPSKQNSFCAEVMLVISSIVHLGKSGLPQKSMTEDDYDRMMLCLQVCQTVFSALVKKCCPVSFIGVYQTRQAGCYKYVNLLNRKKSKIFLLTSFT